MSNETKNGGRILLGDNIGGRAVTASVGFQCVGVWFSTEPPLCARIIC